MRDRAAQVKSLTVRHFGVSFAPRVAIVLWNAGSAATTSYMWHGQLEGGSA